MNNAIRNKLLEARENVSTAEDALECVKDAINVALQEDALSQVTIAKAAETDRLTDENRALRMTVDELKRERADRDSEIAKLKATIDNLRHNLDEAREKVTTLDAKLNEATRESEAPKAPAVEVMPGPDYVTRAELVKVLRGLHDTTLHFVANALESKL